ncbi:MAG: site-2 protease family protein [Clostridiales bacterium]|nr:site-2 protease family protein [Clostridiales bacterium]
MNILNRLQAWWNWLTADPVGFLVFMLYYAVAILLTLMLHEIAHGYVAYRCGDPTAKMMGRLTLDPRKHLDPIGTLCLVLLGFGWAKPVPVNPRNFKGNYRRDDFLVSIAGVTTNLTLFITALFLATLINPLLWDGEVLAYYGAKELLSSNGQAFGAILYGMVDSSLLKTPWLMHVQRFLLLFSSMNLTIAVFNLLPIPPLDGFHVLNDLILKGKLTMNRQFFQGAQIVLLLLVFSGALSSVLTFLTDAVEGGVLNLFLLLEGAA